MVDAIVAVEDRRFYSHCGLDPVRIVGAAVRNVRAGGIREGGSTITQQLARAVRLSPARTFERKVREAMLALRLEQRYSKERILQEYLNTVYFGDGYYGVEAAARGYFGKNASALTPPEAALLAAVVRAPSRDVPSSVSRAGAPAAQSRPAADALAEPHQRSRALRRARRAACEPNERRRRRLCAPQVAWRRVLPGGGAAAAARSVSARSACAAAASASTRPTNRHCSAQPSRQSAAASPRSPRAAAVRRTCRAASSRSIPSSGDVLALVGGQEFLPRARSTVRRRHGGRPGSAFKPIIYAAALERGYAPGSMLRDLDTPIGGYGRNGCRAVSTRTASTRCGAPCRCRATAPPRSCCSTLASAQRSDYAHRLGINSRAAVGAVPGAGHRRSHAARTDSGVRRLRQRRHAGDAALHLAHRGCEWARLSGRRPSIRAAPSVRRQRSSCRACWRMSSRAGLPAVPAAPGSLVPAGGKTGTTDNYADAWFIGYTPHLVAGVWFGLDTPAPIMNRGFAGVVAVPAWARFMKAATTNDKPDWYAVPADVEKVAICRLSGARATDACRHAHPADIGAVAARRRAQTGCGRSRSHHCQLRERRAQTAATRMSTKTSFRSGQSRRSCARCTIRRQTR